LRHFFDNVWCSDSDVRSATPKRKASRWSELSRLESRTDHLTSTLRRYVEALGSKLEVTAVFGGRRVKLTDA
jgi:hypothetical protein